MKRRTYHPTLEALEGRVTPAGNLTTHLLGGSLFVLGDREANAVTVTQTAAGQFTLTPDAGTTINGKAEALTLTGVTRDLVLWLGDGDDGVRLGSSFEDTLSVGRSLVIQGGNGENVIESNGTLTVARDLTVVNGRGNDRVELRGHLQVGDNVTIFNGNGDNTTMISPDLGLNNTIGGDLRIINGFGGDTNIVLDTNVGDDVIFDNGSADPTTDVTTNQFTAFNSTERLTVGGDIVFRTTNGQVSNVVTDTDVGDDVVFEAGRSGNATFDLGTGSIAGAVTVGGDVTIRGSRAGQSQVRLGDISGFADDPGLLIQGRLMVNTGTGDDELSLTNVNVNRTTTLLTGAGADRVTVDDSAFRGGFSLATEAGDDAVNIETRSGRELEGATEIGKEMTINLGQGNDTLRLGAVGDPARRVVTPKGHARLDGGLGNDLLDAANLSNAATTVSFETKAPAPFFRGPVRYDVGEYILAVKTADFNGDGILDLITSNQDSETLSILMGKGDGTFSDAVSLDAGRNPQGLAVADFNGDGKLDIAVANNTGPNGTVSVFLSNGDGTFGTRTTFRTGTATAPVEVATGDFNQDGRLDLVTVNRAGNNEASVSLLLGNGDGTFQTAAVTPLGQVNGGSSLAVGDLNGDGKLDVVASTIRALAVLLGNGDGTFQTSTVEERSPLTSVTLADLNRDGRLDLILGGNQLQVQLGNGDGTFAAPTTLLDEGTTGGTVGDFNGDGIPDIAVAHFPEAGSLFLGKGDGTFQAAVSFSPGLDDGPLTAGDFNGDGLLDLAVGNQEAASVSVLLNNHKAGA
jgi:hypothetical protein